MVVQLQLTLFCIRMPIVNRVSYFAATLQWLLLFYSVCACGLFDLIANLYCWIMPHIHKICKKLPINRQRHTRTHLNSLFSLCHRRVTTANREMVYEEERITTQHNINRLFKFHFFAFALNGAHEVKWIMIVHKLARIKMHNMMQMHEARSDGEKGWLQIVATTSTTTIIKCSSGCIGKMQNKTKICIYTCIRCCMFNFKRWHNGADFVFAF